MPPEGRQEQENLNSDGAKRQDLILKSWVCAGRYPEKNVWIEFIYLIR